MALSTPLRTRFQGTAEGFPEEGRRSGFESHEVDLGAGALAGFESRAASRSPQESRTLVRVRALPGCGSALGVRGAAG
jgi:hypothetical protein